MRRRDPNSSAVIEPVVQSAEQPTIDREHAEALHREIDRLPRSFRLAVVLCYFEGLTLDETARRLRWPVGTVRSRLARARDKLRLAPSRRGIVLSTSALAAALAPRSATAFVSSPLCDSTTKAAMNFAAGKAAVGVSSTSAMVLAQEVLKSMVLDKLKFIALNFLFLGAVATGAGSWNHSFAMKDKLVKNPAARAPNRPMTQANTNAPGRMIVAGRVLDPEGKPINNATVDLVARPHTVWIGASADDENFTALGFGQTDNDGHFHLEVSRTSSTRFFDVIAIGSAPGFGLGWAELNPDA